MISKISLADFSLITSKAEGENYCSNDGVCELPRK